MDDFWQTIKQLGPARLAIMGGVMLGLLIFFIFISMRISTPEMTVMYSDLSPTDSAAMVSVLEQADITFEVSEDGTTIRAPENVIGRGRMLLAQEGLPGGGSMGYELFDQQSGFGTTNFVQNINQVRALEGELARTISSLDQIRSARVHLVLPQRELFSRESRPSSASVFLSQRPGISLSREQILSIQSLIASAVPELKAQNVSVIDSEGNLLARGGEEETSLMTMKAEEMRRNYERRMTSAIEDMVGRIVGHGRVRANVTADLNFDRVSTEEQLFDPESQVVRSSQVIEENNLERTPAGDNVSVDNNLPGLAPDAVINKAPTLENSRVEEVTNYEISRTVRSMVSETGQVKRLSVAVLVDGTYTTGENGEKIYEPRSEEELDQIAALVQSAIGYDANRGDILEVANLRFADVDTGDNLAEDTKLFGFERADLLDAAEIITVAIMIILVVLLVLQPMVGRLLAPEGDGEGDLEARLLAAQGMNPALTGPAEDGFEPPQIEEEDSMIDMTRVEGKVKASSVKKVEDIVENYPQETVSVIRSWMTTDNS